MLVNGMRLTAGSFLRRNAGHRLFGSAGSDLEYGLYPTHRKRPIEVYKWC